MRRSSAPSAGGRRVVAGARRRSSSAGEEPEVQLPTMEQLNAQAEVPAAAGQGMKLRSRTIDRR